MNEMRSAKDVPPWCVAVELKSIQRQGKEGVRKDLYWRIDGEDKCDSQFN